MTTIREVAKMAGVSSATVSRVINGKANVGGRTKAKVLKALNETGYKPNELARALYKRSSKIIGVIVPNIDNPFFSELENAIEEEAYLRGYRILLCSSNNDFEKERVNIQMLSGMKANGIILMTNNEKTGTAVADTDIPVVVVDRHVTTGGEVAYIESDNYQGGVIAAEHLIDCGCKKIVCMRGPQGFTSGMQRYHGYLAVCRKYGIKERVIDTRYDFQSGLSAAKELIKKYPDVDGVFAANDLVAFSAFKVLRSEGKAVPGDVQIVGFDNIKFDTLMTPEFTTIAQPIEKMGQMAVRIIDKLSRGEKFQRDNVFDVDLIKRQTTR